MLKLYNTLTRKIEEFEPLNPPKIGMYACGPTVYDYQHIGHMRRYVGDDILVRVLKLNHFDVKHVMNITDVGHLTSDADSGEDKMEKGAAKYNMSVWDIAKKFERQFAQSMEALNVAVPQDLMHATDYIEDQITLIEVLEKKGFTYKTSDGIYFDSSKFADYTKLSGQKIDELKAGARVDVAGKKHPNDFALWKFSYTGGVNSPSTSSGLPRRQMEWDSPWGKGFPGWHIECSAMSMRALGPTLDIHTGGIDHISIHHTNEIAQSEAATGRQFVKYWVHHAFLLVEGEKMSKSKDNFFTVQDIRKKGFDPLALRYLYLQTHYRQEMNFTWEALEASYEALKDLWEKARVFSQFPGENFSSREPSKRMLKWWDEFLDALNNDINVPAAIAILHRGLKDAEGDYDTAFLLFKTDEILGLNFTLKGQKIEKDQERIETNPKLQALIRQRNHLRKQKKFHKADGIRHRIEKMGYEVLDEKGKTVIRKT